MCSTFGRPNFCATFDRPKIRATFYRTKFVRSSCDKTLEIRKTQPSQGLIQMNWGSRVECNCLSTVWVRERIFDLGGIPNKYTIRCQISRSKNCYVVYRHKLLINLVKDLLKWTEGLGRRVTVWVQSDRERVFTWVVYKKCTRWVLNFRAQKIAM